MRADAIKEGVAAVLPNTVVDQIRLWEQERQRVLVTDGTLILPVHCFRRSDASIVLAGFLYDDFSSASDYELVAQYARELGVLLWERVEIRKMFVTADGHVQVR